MGRNRWTASPGIRSKYYMVVQIWVRNARGELLVQKRRSALEEASGLWATTAGWARAAQDSREAAVGEFGAELGIRASPGELRAVLRRTVDAGLGSAWLLDLTPEEVVPDPDALTGTLWATEDRMGGMVRDAGFFEYGVEYLDRLFGM